MKTIALHYLFSFVMNVFVKVGGKNILYSTGWAFTFKFLDKWYMAHLHFSWEREKQSGTSETWLQVSRSLTCYDQAVVFSVGEIIFEKTNIRPGLCLWWSKTETWILWNHVLGARIFSSVNYTSNSKKFFFPSWKMTKHSLLLVINERLLLLYPLNSVSTLFSFSR